VASQWPVAPPQGLLVRSKRGTERAYFLARVRTEAIKRLPDCVPKDTVRSKKRKKKKPPGDEPSD
jgi:hypothetical protein